MTRLKLNRGILMKNFNEEVINLLARLLQKDKNELINNLNSRNNWDSLTHMEIVFLLESEFEITFDYGEIRSILTIDDLIKTVNIKINEKC
jgi:acyl carrier protein